MLSSFLVYWHVQATPLLQLLMPREAELPKIWTVPAQMRILFLPWRRLVRDVRDQVVAEFLSAGTVMDATSTATATAGAIEMWRRALAAFSGSKTPTCSRLLISL